MSSLIKIYELELNNSFNDKMNISTLPINNSAPLSNDDIQLATHIFGAKAPPSTHVSNFLKTPVLVALIVGFMLHPLSDTLANKVYANDNKYLTIAVKMVLAAILFFIINNWALARA